MSRLANQLAAGRRRLFVGRQDGKALFQSLLDPGDPPFFLLHIFGPGGIGKTTLLREMRAMAEEAGAAAVPIQGDAIEPTPDVFNAALRLALAGDGSQGSLELLAARAAQRCHILLIDAYEALLPLDDWLREHFMPNLPENVFAVLAGREPPTPGWRRDAGWQEALETLALRNLNREESGDFLTRRRTPAAQHDAIIDFTPGHPLALSLVADLFDQRPDTVFRPDAEPNIIKTLLEQFLDDLPSPQHRAALDLCCLVRGTTEALLAETLGAADAPALFAWLRRLSFVDSGSRGLFPHDLAREALHTDLRWRNLDWYIELHHRARQYYARRLQITGGAEQQRTLFDYIFLHRDNPVVRPFYDWQAGAGHTPDRLRPADVPALVEMVRRHEGDESAALAAHWLHRQPDHILVLRNTQGRPVGFMALLALHLVDAEDERLDPALAKAGEHLRSQDGLRPGETATHFRFWMGEESYQDVGPLQTLIFINCIRHYLTTPHLAYTFFTCAQPEFWEMGFTYADLPRAAGLDFTVGGRRYGVYMKDWRATPPTVWLDMMADRELGMAGDAPPPPAPQPLVALSRESFDAAALAALRDLHKPDVLAENPLLRSRLVAERVGREATTAQRVAALQELVRSSLAALQATPKENKLYRAVHHTYVQPAPTQEAAAELLDLPFSTYRRHLKGGVTRMTEILWQMETAGVQV